MKHMNGRRALSRAAAVVVAGVIGAALLPAGTAVAVHGAVPGDFNGDGYRDAVLPAPGADVAGREEAGKVVVLYGSRSGVSPNRRKTISQNTPGVPGTSEKGDHFGAATATADLNRDGYADLVVSAPYEDNAKGRDAGVVTVLWGSRYGLTKGMNLSSPSSRPLYFGLDLAAVSGGSDARTEVLVSGWDGTVRFTGPFRKRTNTVATAVLEDGTPSVETVALGDFNGDGDQDRVSVTTRMSGLTGGEVYVNPQSQSGIPRPLEHGNGLIAAAGDLDGDGYDDLVVGDPDEPEVAGADGARGGRVNVWYGSQNGIDATARPVRITQNTTGVPDTSEKGDAFGGSLAVADLNRDGRADIVVGAPYESLARKWRTGAVTVIPGRASRTLGSGSYRFTQNVAGVPGANEIDDFFGTTVAAGDINKDGKPELFISAAGENNHTGAVWVFPGGSTRPTATGSRMIKPADVGLTKKSSLLLGGNGLLGVI
ncbi:VCBS repeat-containing protein [Streptomyces sp. NPDC002845]